LNIQLDIYAGINTAFGTWIWKCLKSSDVCKFDKRESGLF